MATIFPSWADELRKRYLRGEASLFVVHGNVHDVVLDGDELISVADFLAKRVFEKKDVVIRYNLSTGCRFIKKTAKVDGLDDLLLQRTPDKVLPALERLLFAQNNVAVIIEYAEMAAPAGDASFSSESDRLAVVMLQRWSLAPQMEASDNIVILMTEVPGELHPKIVTNPRVSAVKVPMPSVDERRAVIKKVNPALDPAWVDRLADITAGLKSIQIKAILQPGTPGDDDADARYRFIKTLITDDSRAKKLAAVTQGMTRDEIQELAGVKAPPTASGKDEAHEEILRLIGKRKREVIERECFGLIEFVEPSFDFSVVGGIEEVKKELGGVAKNIREGRTARVPMGMLFTGPMGTGKTFVAEAFVKESGLTGIKLKNFRSKWVGSTESNLERILGVIHGIGNVIVILDEADRSFGGGGDDGEGDGGTGSRVIARLKEFMSDTANRGRVLFILMTNRPDKLDIDIKRAGRLDRKIPFLYPQTPSEVEDIFKAQIRKHALQTTIEFPRDRALVSEKVLGYSNADFEAIALLANDYAAEENADTPISVAHFQQAVADYLPSRDLEMLEYMELLAVFEASNRRMLPEKYARLTVDELQKRLAELKLRCGSRR
ncbi:MAG: ATPase central domain protein [Myxococcales bacterium]|nr:ATPase central domain protein [Myxococcales bacterium]